jgi:hypothetical protein
MTSVTRKATEGMIKSVKFPGSLKRALQRPWAIPKMAASRIRQHTATQIARKTATWMLVPRPGFLAAFGLSLMATHIL